MRWWRVCYGSWVCGVAAANAMAACTEGVCVCIEGFDMHSSVSAYIAIQDSSQSESTSCAFGVVTEHLTHQVQSLLQQRFIPLYLKLPCVTPTVQSKNG